MTQESLVKEFEELVKEQDWFIIDALRDAYEAMAICEEHRKPEDPHALDWHEVGF